ncbi:ABC transporter permease [Enterococcus sp. AZ109]|uniref:ABC transporter permease n=1 Tax=Enterococcus sp. AZ109 TaxID=2774634 RepID=UPI003F277667
MSNIIKVELYKMYKRKVFVALLILSSFSLLYSLGVFFEWEFVEISGRIDLITFYTVMWSLLMMLGIPMIMFSFYAASILGGEIQEGQILLELSSAKLRKKLVVGKFMAIVLLIGLCYVLNFLLSSLFYVLFISGTKVGSTAFFFLQSYHFVLIMKSLSGFLLLVFLAALSFVFSIRFGVFRSVIFGLVIYMGLKVLMYLPTINRWIPGFLVLYDQADFSAGVMLYQSGLLLVLTVAVILYAAEIFRRMDF